MGLAGESGSHLAALVCYIGFRSQLIILLLVITSVRINKLMPSGLQCVHVHIQRLLCFWEKWLVGW